MYCGKCGEHNVGEAVFCRRCAAMLATEDETVVRRRPLAPNNAIDHRPESEFSVRPTLRAVKIGYFAAVVAAFVFAALVSGVFAGLSPWLVVVAGFALLLVPAFYHLRRGRVRYRMTGWAIEAEHGIFARTTVSVPLRAVREVTVAKGIFQRLLGSGDVIVGTDGGRDDFVLEDVEAPQRFAKLLLNRLDELGDARPRTGGSISSHRVV